MNSGSIGCRVGNRWMDTDSIQLLYKCTEGTIFSPILNKSHRLLALSPCSAYGSRSRRSFQALRLHVS